jgi:outer membrane protein TolC
MRERVIRIGHTGLDQLNSSAAAPPDAARRKGMVQGKMRVRQTWWVVGGWVTRRIILPIGIALFIFNPRVGAQASSTGGTTQTQATQLPLSGRAGQNGSVATSTAPIPGTTTSVNTLNPTVQVSGAYTGSASGTARTPFTGKLSLREAIQRGLEYNLGRVGLTQAARESLAQTKAARSSLMPNLNGDIAETVQTTNLATFGIRISVPGFTLPTVVGPFNYIDFRAKLTQTVANLTALNNYRAAQETAHASQASEEDARDLVVLGVTGAYLQIVTAQAKVAAARTQVDSANAVYQETADQFQFGTVAQIDVNRSQVESLTQQQRLLSLQDDLGKQKINLARMIGLPANDQYDTTDDVPFSPAPALTVDDALKQAYEQRADLKAAEAQVRAAERVVSAARDERVPSLAVNADYGEIGTNPGQAHGTYTVAATLSIPIWQGGRTEADIEQARATLEQRQAELSDTKGEIEGQIREAYLDLQAAASQVELAQKNIELTQQTLDQTRARLEAGVVINVELVQSEEAVSSAQLDYISSVFAYNVAKLSLARAVGRAADNLPQFLKMQ